MTRSPENLLRVRRLFQEKTGLPPVSLGIQHFAPQGGGYHEGNDLLRAAGRVTTDYSKRESHRDRPGSDDASAIDIGDFSVTLANGRRVTEIDLHRFVERNWNAADAQWVREYIYSTDKRTVKRLDRLGKRTTGDSSHRTHSHVSKFRDVVDDSPYRFFKRFWDEMEGRQIDVSPDEIRQVVNEVLSGLIVGVNSAGYVNQALSADALKASGVSREEAGECSIAGLNRRLKSIEESGE